ncbi:general substrate transporter [Epithele typhae]|uniref:general substrate transporter n=1 Tax=Epithele typhae TaxID=378194 RepID=UPI0020084582|nr:general substrate transporter [Epithele typhae]KAH9935235.1 general substrate transporter [Epithele typhae]
MKDFMSRWHLTAWDVGLMTSALELGSLVGALLAGVSADKFSRRQSIFAACAVFTVGSALQFGAQSPNHLILGRGIGGLGVGALSMLAPLYMAEISPPEVRGSLMALEQFAIVLGAVLGFWTGFFTRDLEGSASWRIPLGIQLIPGVLLGLGCLALPASPRLLVSQGHVDEALSALAKLRLRPSSEQNTDPLLQIELLEMQVEAALIEQSAGSVKTSSIERELLAWRRLFGPKLLRRTLIGVLMMVFQQWSGINALLYYGPTLMQSLGLQGDSVTLMSAGGIGIVQFIAVLPAIAYIDRLGRRPLLRWGSLAMALSHLLIAIFIIVYGSSWSEHPAAAYASLACVYAFTAAYGVSYGPIGWILPSEVFPLSARSQGVALSTASNWINNFLIGLLTPVLIERSAAGTFLIFAAACAAGYVWATRCVPETANVSLEEIDAVFGSSAAAEDAALKHQIAEDLGLPELVRRWANASVHPDHTD